MKKLLFVVVFFWLIIVCIASCTSKMTLVTPSVDVNVCNDATCPAPPAPPGSNLKSAVTIKEDNWEFVLPNHGWVPIKDAPLLVTKSLINKDKHNMLLFSKESFIGTPLQYYYLALQDIRNSGASLLSSKNVDINGHKFLAVEIVSASGHSKIWNWISYDKGFGYLLSCGGPIDYAKEEQELCSNIVLSLKID